MKKILFLLIIAIFSSCSTDVEMKIKTLSPPITLLAASNDYLILKGVNGKTILFKNSYFAKTIKNSFKHGDVVFQSNCLLENGKVLSGKVIAVSKGNGIIVESNEKGRFCSKIYTYSSAYRIFGKVLSEQYNKGDTIKWKDFGKEKKC